MSAGQPERTGNHDQVPVIPAPVWVVGAGTRDQDQAMVTGLVKRPTVRGQRTPSDLVDGNHAICEPVPAARWSRRKAEAIDDW